MKDLVSELKTKMQQEKQRKKEAASSDTLTNEARDISSDEDSDSGESEDNLDADQLQQIMPKKIFKKGNAGNQGKKKKNRVSAQVTIKKVM